MSKALRFFRGAVTLASLALAAALLLLGIAAYQHAHAELRKLMQVVGRDVLLLARDWSKQDTVVTPDFAQELRVFAARLAGFQTLALRASGGRPPNRFAYYSSMVTPEFFAVCRYPLVRGRVFVMGRREAVVGHDHAALLGRTITVRGIEVRVVGVLGRVSKRGGPDRYVDGTVFVPYDLQGATVPMDVYLKFKSEKALSAALPQVELWLRQGGYFFKVQPLANLYGLELRKRLHRVMGGALLWGLVAVLLTAGVELSSYQLARALERVRELGIRRAVGATAADLRRELLVGSLGWALAGLVLGIVMALGLADGFARETGLMAKPTASTVVWVGLGLGVLVLVSAVPSAQWAASQSPASAIRGIAVSLPRQHRGLALVGLALAVAAFSAQLGITQSASAYTRKAVGDLSRATAIYSSFLYLRRHALTDPRAAPPLRYADYRALLASPIAHKLKRAAYVENYYVRFAGPAGRVETFLRAYEGPYPDLAGARLILGHWPRAGAGELALGRELAKRLFGRLRDALGQELLALGRRWLVVGVYAGAMRPAPGNAAEDQALLPRADLKRTLPGARAEILVQKRSAASDRIFLEVGQFLTARHPEPGYYPVEPLRRDDLAPQLRNVLERLAAAYRLLAVVILSLAGSGLMAQTFVSISHRVRELGIRRAVGASRAQVFVELLLPLARAALSAGLVGSLLGLGVAYLVVRTHQATWSVPWGSTALVVLAAPLLAVLAAGLPAWQAACRSPAEAVRQE